MRSYWRGRKSKSERAEKTGGVGVDWGEKEGETKILWYV